MVSAFDISKHLNVKPYVTYMLNAETTCHSNAKKIPHINAVSDFVTYMLTAKTTCHLIARKNSAGTYHKKNETTRYFFVLYPRIN